MIKGMTKGIKSSEFIVSILGVVGGLVCALFSESEWVPMVALLLTAVCGKTYTDSRKTVKAAIALGAAKVDAARIEAEVKGVVGKSEA
tara:strand:- start:932 stop:1195 length:264 start_codon:yes stop_codon:yes gene_type:complete